MIKIVSTTPESTIGVFDIKIHPNLEVIQLPNLNINSQSLRQWCDDNAIKYSGGASINRQLIEYLFTMREFKHLIVLKYMYPVDTDVYNIYGFGEQKFLYVDLTMTELLTVGNLLQRISNIAAFA